MAERPKPYSCACEYPCSCIEFEGKRYSGRDDLIQALAAERDTAQAELQAERDTGNVDRLHGKKAEADLRALLAAAGVARGVLEEKYGDYEAGETLGKAIRAAREIGGTE
jgi:hypothetical protein